MAKIPTGKPLHTGVTGDLHAVRERGVDRIDLNTKKQPRKQLCYLEPLAVTFRVALGLPDDGRIEAIRSLLLHALAAFAKRGHTAERLLIEQLLFDPPGLGPRLPLGRMKAVRAKSPLLPDAFDAQWHAAFDLFGRFLVAYVRAAARQTAARQTPPEAPQTAVVVTPQPPLVAPAARQPRRRRRVRWVHVMLVGLVVAAVAVARLLAGSVTPPNGAAPSVSAHATIIAGSVECWPDTTQAVEGVWIVASNGGSDWADWHALPGHPNIAVFSRTLPHGGSYVVHAGCGGTPQHWQLALDSITPTMGSGYYFTCYDSYAADNPYNGQCRP